MHLLAATPGTIEDANEPVDLGQSPSDVVFLSAADTELAALSAARAEISDAPGLRLANLTHLQHPMSVDLHLDQCATRSRLVIARVLGGVGYWKYGAEQFAARCHEAGVPLALLPGDDKPDAELRDLSTVKDADYDALWSYLVEGGPENAGNFLRYARTMLEGGEPPASASPLLRAGVYWPGAGVTGLVAAQDAWTAGQPVVAVLFYRALVQGAGLHPINRLVKSLLRAGLNPLPIFVASLKDPVSVATLDHLFTAAPPSVILNATSFAVGSPHAGDMSPDNPLVMPAADGAPVFQVVLAGSSEEAWATGLTGLSGRDIAMNVALPEVDGRILSRAISFKGEAFFDEATECPIATYRAVGDRVDFVARLTANWASLRQTPAPERRVALILANYPNKDGRLANGVGLDTPAATVHALGLLQSAGYDVGMPPADSGALMRAMMAGPTNWLTDRAEREGGETLPLAQYREHFDALPWALKEAMTTRWGAPEDDPFLVPEILNSDGTTGAGFALSVLTFGHVVVGLQPARGYNIDPTDTYHSPDLVPPHNYLAFYIWLRHRFGAQAIVHMGKHGNLEWLPGKALALSDECWPEAVLGPMPHIYPFIVNDPGEGTQAKRRAQAVIVDHLTPPLTRAETYGPLRDLEALVDEYYEAAGVDPRRIHHLRREILTLTSATGLDKDVGMAGEDEDTDLARLDAYLCELKEAQIRDGLHVFGQSPTGRQEADLAIALARVPRGDGRGGDASLIRALATDHALGIDPLDCDMAAPASDKPQALAAVSDDPWRSNGDTVERLELLAQRLLQGHTSGAGPAAAPVLKEITQRIRPAIAACGPDEGAGLLRALDGRALAPGP
ncbi:cobaltochelatase subunit CobN, partial [uncultured Roseovarius sp.]|uniref:cobaltochelatase subunit CobN n=1 Tax=uncultured Roseovarius sp. TaxID=293344 RepID=UPI00260CCBAC